MAVNKVKIICQSVYANVTFEEKINEELEKLGDGAPVEVKNIRIQIDDARAYAMIWYQM